MAHVIAYKEKIYPDRMAGGGGGGSSEATVIFNTFTSTTGEITLSDDITNYTDLEFYIKSSSDGTTMVYRVNVQEFMREFPNVASPNERTPHFLPTIWSQSGCYSRIIMGTANNKLLVYQCSSQGVDKIVGINYGSGGGSAKVLVYELQQGSRWETFTNPNSDQPLIVEAENNGAVYSWQFIPELLPAREGGDRYITIGSMLSGPPINLGQMNGGGTIYISTNGTYDTSKAYVKVYKVG